MSNKKYFNLHKDTFKNMDKKGMSHELQFYYSKLLISSSIDGYRAKITNERLQSIFNCGYRRAMTIVKSLEEFRMIKVHYESGMTNTYEFLEKQLLAT